MTSRSSHIWLSCLATLGLLLTAQTSRAAFTVELGETFTGENPSGAAPWLTAQFEQQNSTTVRVTLTSNLNSADEFVSDWLFNLNPNKNIADLTSNKISSSLSQDPVITLTADSFQLNSPSGDFDISFSFEASNSGGGSKRFSLGSSVVYDFSLADGLSESDFNFGTANSTFSTAPVSGAHVQGIATGAGSGKIRDSSISLIEPVSAPAPAGVVLVASALPLLGLRRFVRRRSEH